jgi:hypothetical protein
MGCDCGRVTRAIHAHDPVTITLEAQQWNVVIEALHNVAYGIAAPLIGSIVEQAMAAQPEETGTEAAHE